MERHLDRRALIRIASGLAATAVVSRPVRAQQVKWSAGTAPAKLRAPPNAADCHHHIYDARYPADAKAALRPGTPWSRTTAPCSGGLAPPGTSSCSHRPTAPTTAACSMR